MKNLIIFFSCALLLSSCTYYAYYPTGESVQNRTMPSNIKIYSTQEIGKDYKVLGSFCIYMDGNAERVSLELKKRLSKIGADAAVDVKLSKLSSFDARSSISGTAIIFVD